ncbi:hypothetical protein [Nocardia sp. NPDC003963]
MIIEVEAQCLEIGIGLSGQVAAAIPDAVAALLDEVGGSRAGTSGHKAHPGDDLLL